MNNIETNWIVSAPVRKLFPALIEFTSARTVLYALIKRDLKSRYRTSLFGFAWAFSKPLMQLAVYTLVIGGILGASRSITNFSIFIFCGLMFWNFFAESVNTGSFSIVASAGLVTKISFPREILPIASVLIAGVNLLIQVPVLILGYLVTGARPDFSHVGFVFPVLITLFFLSISAALLLSALNVYARDIQPLSELLTTLLMYLCPVIYSWTFVHDELILHSNNWQLFRFYELNPFVQILTVVQDFFWNGTRMFADGSFAPRYLGLNLEILWTGAFTSVVIALATYKFFLKLEPNFAREL